MNSIDGNLRHTYTSKLINKNMIPWAGVIKKRIDGSHCIPMNFIVNHTLYRVTENLRCNGKSVNEKHMDLTKAYKMYISSSKTHLIDIVNEHAEICGFWVIATQVWMARFHTVIVSFLNLLLCSIWKLLT